MAARAPTSAGPLGPNAQQSNKIPVTIITGFLGAGKTTLLNYILKARAERHISVIENEFGEVNIDNELVADNLIEKEDLVSLDNGCVCCSLRKDIVKALAEIERRSRHRNKRVDQVILETTGLADPAPVAFTFFANPWIVSRYRLDSIVCVVDTRYVMQHLDEDAQNGGINEIAQQLAFSDLILLNKTDLIDKEQLAVVQAAVRRINQSAQLLECRLNTEGGQPPLSLLLENNSFSVNKALQVDPDFLQSDSGSDLEISDTDGSGSDSEDGSEEGGAEGGGATTDTAGGNAAAGNAAAEPEGSTATCCAHHQHKKQRLEQQQQQQQGQQQQADSLQVISQAAAEPCSAGAKRQACGMGDESAGQCFTKGDRRPKRRRKQLHDLSGVGSVGIVARGPLDEYRFNMFMRDLLAEKAKDIFRCKGVLAVHGYGNQRFVFQGVHETICYGPSDKPWGDTETRINQIVFIGRKLDRKALMEGFRTCVWTKLPEGWQEFQDPLTLQPYYYNPNTKEKTWARPVEPNANPNTVTATRLMSMEQPRDCLPGSSKRRNTSATGNGHPNNNNAQTNSSSSTLSAVAAAGGVGAVGAAAAGDLQQQQLQLAAAPVVAPAGNAAA